MAVEIAVVDDLAADRIRLISDIRSWLCRSGREAEVSFREFPDGMSFLHDGGLSGRTAIVFLDICMEELSGIETAARLRRGLSDCLIIFITTAREFALDAYPFHPFDYLVKPYERARLDQVLSDAFRILEARSETAEIRVPHGTIRIPVDRIESAVARGHAVDFRLKDGTRVISNASFSETSERLAGFSCFLLINRGVLINMNLVFQVQKGSVVMQSEAAYPIRVRDRSELIRTLTQFQIQRRMGGAGRA